MNNKLRLFDELQDWESAEAIWEKKKAIAKKTHPLKILKTLPEMPGITRETAKYLKWKSLYWMIAKDKGLKIFKSVMKHPFLYIKRYLNSFFSKEAYQRQGDFFLYGMGSIEDFEKALLKPKTFLVLGFSYCHKPFECPSGRFTDQCIHDLDNPICQQCFIGKCTHAAPSENVIVLYIPTVHYIGQKIFEIKEKYPDQEVIFLITACEMTLTMFADFGNMAGIKGIGVRLDGRICNTMKAFSLSEEGIKPGLTVVLVSTQEQMLRFIKIRRDACV